MIVSDLRQTGTNNSSTSNTTSGRANYQNDRAIPGGEEIELGTDRRVLNVQCNRCNAWEHYATTCPRVSNSVSKKNMNTTINNDYLTPLCYILDAGSTHNTVEDQNFVADG